MLNIGKVYNLILKYPILGSKINNLELIGILPFKEAIKQFDVISQHEKVLKTVTVNDVINSLDYRGFIYHHFKDTNGSIYMLPLEYVANYSESGNDFTFLVKDISLADKNVIKAVLLNNGYIIEEV